MIQDLSTLVTALSQIEIRMIRHINYGVCIGNTLVINDQLIVVRQMICNAVCEIPREMLFPIRADPGKCQDLLSISLLILRLIHQIIKP